MLDHVALVRQLIPAVLEAGACLLKCRADGVLGEEKGDGSPVSRADREAEAILLAALARLAPHVPVIAEEAVSAGVVPSFEDEAFLVDALDGTREFLRGGDDFTVNIGLVRSGVPVLGLVFAPVGGRLFATTELGVAAEASVRADRLLDGSLPQMRPIRTAEPDRDRVRVVSSRSHRSSETEAFLARFGVASDMRIGSSVKFGIIAAGEADLYPRHGPTSAWDIAAGHAVLAAAGGVVTTLEGNLMKYLDKSKSAGAEPFLNPSFVAWGRASLLVGREA